MVCDEQLYNIAKDMKYYNSYSAIKAIKTTKEAQKDITNGKVKRDISQLKQSSYVLQNNPQFSVAVKAMLASGK